MLKNITRDELIDNDTIKRLIEREGVSVAKVNLCYDLS